MAITVDVLMARLGLDISQVDEHAGQFANKMHGMASAAAQSFGAIKGLFQGVVGVAVAGGAALSAILTKGSREAAAAEQVWERLGIAIQNNGLRARVTTGFIEGLAVSMEKLTTQGDETTAQMATMLLKFENIKGQETFERAIRAAKDFAAATGQDAVGAVNILGRSLENPAMGARMLKMQAGLAAAELKKIQDLEKAGYHTQAQEALLSAFERKFRGAAEREAKTFSGRMAQLSNTIGNIFEEIGGFINPKIKILIKDMNEAATETLEWIQENKKLIQMHVDKWWDRLAAAINRVRIAFKNVMSGGGSIKDFLVVAGVFTTMGKGLELIGGRIPIIGGLIAAIGRLVNPLTLIRGLSGAILPILRALIPAITAATGPIGWVVIAIGALVAGLAVWITKTESGGKAWEKFKEKLDGVLGWFKGVWGKFWENHGEQISRIGDKIRKVLIIAWDKAKDAAEELGRVFSNLFDKAEWGWLGELFSDIKDKVGQILDKFGSPVWKATTEMLSLSFKALLTTVETLLDLIIGTDTNLIKARWLDLIAQIHISFGRMIRDIGKGVGVKLIEDMGSEMIQKGHVLENDAMRMRMAAKVDDPELKREKEKADQMERQASAAKETAEARKEEKEAVAGEKEEENPFAVPGAPAFDPNAEFDPNAPVPGWEWTGKDVQAKLRRSSAIPLNARATRERMMGAAAGGRRFNMMARFRDEMPETTGESPDAWKDYGIRDVQEGRAFRLRENKRMRAEALRERRKSGGGAAFGAQLEELSGLDSEVGQSTQGVVEARRNLEIASRKRGPGREEAIASAREALQTAQTLAQAAQDRFVKALENIAKGSEELLGKDGPVAKQVEEGAEEMMDDAGKKIGNAAEKAGKEIVDGGKKAGKKIEDEAVAGEKKLAKKKMEAQEAANAEIANHLSSTLNTLTSALTGAITGASAGNAKVSQMLSDMSPEERRKTMLSKAEAELFTLKNSRGFIERSFGFGGVLSTSEQAANITKIDRQIEAKKREVDRLRKEGYDPFPELGGGVAASVDGYNSMVSNVDSAYASSASRYGSARSGGTKIATPASRSAGSDGPVSITINQQFAKKYSKDEVRELADGMEEEMRRRGRNMHGRSVLRGGGTSTKLPQDSRIR